MDPGGRRGRPPSQELLWFPLSRLRSVRKPSSCQLESLMEWTERFARNGMVAAQRALARPDAPLFVRRSETRRHCPQCFTLDHPGQLVLGKRGLQSWADQWSEGFPIRMLRHDADVLDKRSNDVPPPSVLGRSSTGPFPYGVPYPFVMG